MTLISSIITKAYRQSNIIPIGTSPTVSETTEALDHLNSIVKSSVGNEIGDEFVDINVGGPWDQSRLYPQWLPDNARLLLNVSSATTFYLDPLPEDGQRLSYVDVLGTLATYNITLNGNGRNIEGASSLLLDTDGSSSEWMYRADTGNWVKLTTLISSDPLPFPEDFDDYFILMLNLRLVPMHNQSLSPENMELLKRGKRNIQARYRNKKSVYPEYMGRLYTTQRILRENANCFFQNFGM